jgi:hypothetical protein
MAFNAANLSGVDYLNSDQGAALILDYSTGDNVSTVEGAGYFNSGLDSFRRGDVLRVTANDGKGLYLVSGANQYATNVELFKLAVVTSFV